MYRDRGRLEQAEEYLRRALEVWEHAVPEFVWARRARAALEEVHSTPRLPSR